MRKIIEVFQGPLVTEVGTIGRVVSFDDGSGEIQSYTKSTGWTRGGTDVQSMLTSVEEVTREMLEERDFTPEQIEEVLFDPEQSE